MAPQPADDQAAAAVTSLRQFLDASPSPYHAVATAEAALLAAGFVRVDTADSPWSTDSGPAGRFHSQGGLLVAWSGSGSGSGSGSESRSGSVAPRPSCGWRIIGAHTDSPNLRIKPRPDLSRAGFAQVGVDVYGGALVNSWLDRDLGLSGRVQVRDGAGVATRLVRVDEATLRVAQLAIHLDRDVNERGVQLDRQLHLSPVWGTSAPAGGFRQWLADKAAVAVEDVLGFEIMTHDCTRAAVLGHDASLLASGRLDNLVSCWAAVGALLAAVESRDGSGGGPPIAVVMYDHEEVGSQTATGAASTALSATIERWIAAHGGGRSDFLAALSSSVVASADMAHGAHPNYLDRVEPEHMVVVNQGPALKINANARYATDALSAAHIVEAAERAGVRLQTFVSRSNLPCGSTIGPAVATQLGVSTVDVGAPMLSMHSARELMGIHDVEPYRRLLTSFLLGSTQ